MGSGVTLGGRAGVSPFPPRPLCPPQRVEVLRENQYKTWTFNKSTTVPVVFMMVVLPLIAHHYFKKEQVPRAPASRACDNCALCCA